VHLIRKDRIDLLPRSKFTQSCGLGLSPDAKHLLVGRLIYLGRPGDEVELYDADTLTRLSGWNLGKDDDQPYVAWPATGGSGGVHLWEPQTTAATPVHSIAVSPDRKLIAATSYHDNTVHLWEAPSLAPRPTAFDPTDGGKLAFAGAGTLIIEQTDGLTAVSIATGAVLWRADLGTILLGLAASEDTVLATSDRGGFFRLDARTGRVVVHEPSLNGSALAFLPGGNIAHLGVDDAVRVLTPEAKELARILPVRESAGAWVIADGTFERIGDPARELICRASGKVVPFARCASLERRGLLTNLLSHGTSDPR
jgi:outer membrane protein assembly factor BamB